MKKEFNKILLFGYPATGKSTTAVNLAKITGFPHLHADEYRYGLNYALQPIDNLAEAVKNTVENNDQWIIDFMIDDQETEKLFDWILDKADLAISFASNPEKCVEVVKKRQRDFNSGIMPHGIPIYDSFASPAALELVSNVINGYSKKHPSLMNKLDNHPTQIVTLNSFDEIDLFVEKIRQRFGIQIELPSVNSVPTCNRPKKLWQFCSKMLYHKHSSENSFQG